MPERKINELGELQRSAMEIVWKLGESSVAQVRERLNKGRRKHLAYTTVLTALQKLEAAGWLTHRSEGKTYIYRPMRSREEAGTATLRIFLNEVFAGSPLTLFQHLLKDQELTESELSGLRRMIDEHRKAERGEQRPQKRDRKASSDSGE